LTRAKKKARKKSTSTSGADPRLCSDPATHYAEEVVAGRIVTGPYVALACERHLRDLKDAHQRGLTWRLDLANKVRGYFREVLRLNGGQFEDMPFILELWQAFVVMSIFGWVKSNGKRRFRTGYIEIGKGNGKSPMAAGIGLYCLTADGEARAEVYAAASTKEQAMVSFRDAVAMRDQSPALASKLIKYGGLNPWNMFYPRTDSFFRTISADERQSGPRPHCGLCDELHEHPTADVVDMLRAGWKFREQPLTIETTNSGVNRNSVCWQHHEYAVRVLEQKFTDDAFFAYVCALHPGDDYRKPKNWIKANPNLGVSVTDEYLSGQVTIARGMPTVESKVKRLNFCEWVDAATPWIDGHKWRKAESDTLNLADYRGSRCWGGLDLSARGDLTALVLPFLRPDGTGFDAFSFFWTPTEGIQEREERDRVPYRLWRDQGFLETTPGAVVQYRYVAERIIQFREEYGLVALAFDRYRIEQLKDEFDDLGFEYTVLNMDADEEAIKKATGLLLIQHGQGFKDMTPAVEALSSAVIAETLRVKKNPVMTMCSANAVVITGGAEEKKFDKRKSTGRIDGIVAGAMAVSCAERFKTAVPGTIYDREGLMLV
jgi:phage terminase large subunit-like protein